MVSSLAAYTDRAFLTPAVDRPQHSDAIVVLGGDDRRVPVAMELAAAGWSAHVVLSVASIRYNCPHQVPAGITVSCFVPEPFSTQGEARAIAGQARRNGWTQRHRGVRSRPDHQGPPPHHPLLVGTGADGAGGRPGAPVAVVRGGLRVGGDAQGPAVAAGLLDRPAGA